MKKSNMIITGAAALVALVAVSGIAFSTYAQTASNPASSGYGGQMMRGWQSLTDEQKERIEARRQEMDAARTKIQEAMNSGYDAWKAAVTQYYGQSAGILSQVTAGNFAKYKEAMGYMDQARTMQEKGRVILDEIGVDARGFGFGGGKGMMGGRGFGGGGHDCPMADTGTN